MTVLSVLSDAELLEIWHSNQCTSDDLPLLRAVADAAVAADRAGRGEPFAYCFTDVNGRAKEFCDPPECAHPHDKRIITPLYTHPPHIGESKKMVLPEKLKHTKVTLTEHDHGYIKGWNDCRETLLATQKEPTT